MATVPRPFPEQFWPRYGLAVIAVVVAVLVRLLVTPHLGDRSTFTFPFIAVLVTARFGGFGPAVFATGLAALATVFFIIEPMGSFAVARIDQQIATGVFIVTALGIAALGGAMHRALRVAEAAASEATIQREELRITLASIGDAVVVVDAQALIVSLNPVAELLTGWTSSEALGRPLNEVFVIVHETTREPAANPVDRVIAEGVVQGLANHTVLLSRDGKETPIDDSAAPIFNGGNLVGAVLVFRNVAERRRAEVELLRSERELRRLADSMPQIVFASRPSGEVEYYNRRWYEYTGTVEGDRGENTWDKFIHPDDLQPLKDKWNESLRQTTPLEVEVRFRDVEGFDRWHLVRALPVYDEEGRVARWYGSSTDIHERKLVERRLQTKARVLESMAEGVSLTDENGIIVYTNPAEDRMFGYATGELLGQSVAVQNDYEPEESQRRVNAVIDHVKRTGVWTGSWTNRRKDGSSFLTQARITSLEVLGIRYFVCVQEDVTEKLAAVAGLQASEQRLRLALEAGRMGTWDWNIGTNDVQWSPSLEVLHGLQPGTFPGTFDAYQSDIHPDDRRLVLDSIQKSLDEGVDHHLEYRLIWPDGSHHWVEARGKLFKDEAGRPVRMIGVCAEITERKRTEQHTKFLADASATLAGLVDLESTLEKVARLAVPAFADWCAVDMLDENGMLKRVAVVHVEPSKVELAHEIHRRWPPDPGDETGVWKVIRTGQAELVPELSDELIAATVRDAELHRIMQELGLRSYIGAPLEVRGRVLGALTFISAESGRRYDARDLSLAEDLAHRAAVAIENARLYQEVREADRRKENFLSLLAHELRNPLAPVRNGLQILQVAGLSRAAESETPVDREMLGSIVEMMERQVHHLVRLVDDLLDVSRIMRNKIELRRERIDLATVVQRAVETSQPSVDAAGHSLSVRLPEEPVYLQGDLVRLVQALGNLINNAARYTDPGGKIEVIAERRGDEAVVCVLDSGLGIAPEMITKIWDMFVQADESSNYTHGGMGIGLTLVKSLVEMHHGRVEAKSDGLGRGSEFVIALPVADSAGETYAPTNDVPAARSSPKRLLVVDDNVDAAESLAMLLRLAGHETRVAHDGVAALELAAADPPDLAFLDVGMPLMDGYELARRFREHPRLKDVVLVALTGWGQESDRRRTKEAGFDAHEVKPVEPATLNRLLDGVAAD